MSQLTKFIGADASNDAAKAAQGQGKANAAVQKQYLDLFKMFAPQLGATLNAVGDTNPTGAVTNALNTLNQDPSQRIAKFGAGATESAANNAAAQANFMKSQGFGDGATAGAGAGLFQNAAAQTNQYAADQMDPETMLRYIQAVLQAVGSQGTTYENLLAALSSGVYGSPQVQQVPNPLMQILGQAAGAYTSAYASKAGAKAA